MRNLKEKAANALGGQGLQGVTQALSQDGERDPLAIARNLLSQNLPLDQIASVTGLDLSRIRSLQEEVQKRVSR